MVAKSWRKNLYAIFIAEFLVLMGFSFVNPFLPLYIQQLGNYTNDQAAFWSGLAIGGSGIAMFFSAPLWGVIADRWGRKPMVLRSQFGSAIVLTLMGLAPNVHSIIVLRFIQGLLSGTVAAASALIAATTPRDKMPFAMGLLMVAVFGGSTLGPLLGGSLADITGYKSTFFITGGLLLTGALVVLFFVKEDFIRPAPGQGVSLGSLWRLAKSREMLPLLIALGALQMGTQMIQPVIPVLMRELDPVGKVATLSGLAFSLLGMVAALSAFVSGRLDKRISLKTMLIVSCLGTSLLYLPPIWAGTVVQLLFFVAMMGLMKGGLMTSSNTLVSLSVAQSEQGIAFGLAQSANALGNGFGPLLGGALAPLVGLRAVFGFASGLFLVTGLTVSKLLSMAATGDAKLKNKLNQ